MLELSIPRALFYYEYQPYWTAFFQHLGVKVNLSEPTNRSIVDMGVRMATDGTCLPVKACLGHVLTLSQQGATGPLFVPRVVSVEQGRYICPKFMGLPDMIRAAIGPDVQIVSPLIDVRRGRSFLDGAVGTARELGLSPRQAMAAHHQAQKSMYPGKQQSLDGDGRKEQGALRIGLLGHSYMLQDPYLSMDVENKLRRLGAVLLTMPGRLDPDPQRLQPRCRALERMYWASGAEQLMALQHFTEQGCDGTVHLTAFACGTDSVIAELLKKAARKPHLTLNIDEHSGEAGIQTRLEAFVDLLSRRKQDAG